MIKSKQVLKAYFETGDVPTQDEFGHLIDSIGSFVEVTKDEKTGLRVNTDQPVDHGDIGKNSIAMGASTKASGDFSHAEGQSNEAIGYASHAEGGAALSGGSEDGEDGESGEATEGIDSGTYYVRSKAGGTGSHVEGVDTRAGKFIGAKPVDTYVSGGFAAHAEGFGTSAEGDYSHTEGKMNIAEGNASHAEGYNTRAKGVASHAGGKNTIAEGIAGFVMGIGNIIKNLLNNDVFANSILAGTDNIIDPKNYPANNCAIVSGLKNEMSFRNHNSAIVSGVENKLVYTEYCTILTGERNTISGSMARTVTNSSVISGRDITGAQHNTAYAQFINLKTSQRPSNPENGTIVLDEMDNRLKLFRDGQGWEVIV